MPLDLAKGQHKKGQGPASRSQTDIFGQDCQLGQKPSDERKHLGRRRRDRESRAGSQTHSRDKHSAQGRPLLYVRHLQHTSSLWDVFTDPPRIVDDRCLPSIQTEATLATSAPFTPASVFVSAGDGT
ncbi:hypothetical protein C0Q70_05513 [Pomacea canaliculata]|uniref:Uncharacterized protein n=1 Tax=Pomacea canaliculata TaxID=400727 RepID=A0A2T7PLD8_POMCA|nr:hypothetical protein C0Q70_05513 [Pomacea canaliculata]